MNKWILVLNLFVLVCVGCKQSNPPIVKDVRQMTFAELKIAADKGNPAAQFEIGERFYDGNGILKDTSEAVEWWQKAAAQGHPSAEYNLGTAYARGDGIPKDTQQALRWFRLAAESGSPEAQVGVGIFYFIGSADWPKDQALAFHWFKAAAEKGYLPAQYYLGICLRDGKGTATNLAESILWLQSAASNGVANAQVALGKHYYEQGFAELFATFGISMTNLVLPTQIKPSTPLTKKQHDNPNFFRGVEWFRKAANQGDLDGQVRLGYAYAIGFGTDQDLVEACKWLTLASGKEPEVTALVESWKTNKVVFTPEQISEGKQRAEEFSKTNHVAPKTVKEIPGL